MDLKDKSGLIDVLWVGNHEPKRLQAKSLERFRVIFNGLENIDELLDFTMLRDSLLTVRSSIVAKTQYCIPNFILDKYYPSHTELIRI